MECQDDKSESENDVGEKGDACKSEELTSRSSSSTSSQNDDYDDNDDDNDNDDGHDNERKADDDNEAIDDDEYYELLLGEYNQLKDEIKSKKQNHKLILEQYEDLVAEQKALQHQKTTNDTFQELSSELLELHQQILHINEKKESNIKILNELQQEFESHRQTKTVTKS